MSDDIPEPRKPAAHAALQLLELTTGRPSGMQVLATLGSERAAGMSQGIGSHVSEPSVKMPLVWQVIVLEPPRKPGMHCAVQVSPATFP